MKSNILNKVISSVVKEQKMVLIVLIIIGCIYYVITNKNREGYKNTTEYDISKLLKRTKYKGLSPENKKLHNAYKENEKKQKKINKQLLDGKIKQIHDLQNPFRVYNKLTNRIDKLNYDKLGIKQLLQSTMRFGKDGKPNRYWDSKKWKMLKKILDIKTLPKMNSYKVFPIICPAFVTYLDSGSCPYPNMALYLYNNIKDILEKFYSTSKFEFVKKNYVTVEGTPTTAYGKELVAPGGLITTLQKFIFAWEKFQIININWINLHTEYNILYTVFKTISIQAYETETTSLAKDIKNMTNIYDVLNIELDNTKTTFKEVAIKSLLPDNNKVIDFIKDEFMYIARLFVYLAEIVKDVMPRNDTSLYSKYSDTENLSLNEYEQKLVETFDNLGNKNLKNDIVYNYIEEKAQQQNRDMDRIWKKLHNNMQSLIRKFYFNKIY